MQEEDDVHYVDDDFSLRTFMKNVGEQSRIILQYAIEDATTGPLHRTVCLAVIGVLALSAVIGIIQVMGISSANSEKITIVALVLWITWLFFGIIETVH
jgi:hypothetical protein